MKTFQEDYKQISGKPEPILYEEVAGCWILKSHNKGDERGRVSRFHKYWKVARYVYFSINGEIPKGLHVLHTCDNARCINPSHLYLGNHRKNMNDRNVRERTARGKANGRSKLYEKDVFEIKHLLPYLNDKELGELYGVSYMTIHSIRVGKSWDWLRVKLRGD